MMRSSRVCRQKNTGTCRSHDRRLGAWNYHRWRVFGGRQLDRSGCWRHVRGRANTGRKPALRRARTWRSFVWRCNNDTTLDTQERNVLSLHGIVIWSSFGPPGSGSRSPQRLTKISVWIPGAFTTVAVWGVSVAYETPAQVTTDVIAPTDKVQAGVFGERLYTLPLTVNCPCSVCAPVHVFPARTLSSHHWVQRPDSSGSTVIVSPEDGLSYPEKWVIRIYVGILQYSAWRSIERLPLESRRPWVQAREEIEEEAPWSWRVVMPGERTEPSFMYVVDVVKATRSTGALYMIARLRCSLVGLYIIDVFKSTQSPNCKVPDVGSWPDI